MKATKDLREYLSVLEAAGELKRIQAQVDWNQEAGAISRLACEKREAAPLFENIKDYPGHRMGAVLLGPGRPLHARIALALGQEDKHIPPLKLIEIVRERFKSPRRPVEVEAKKAPCKEVIIPGDRANLLSFPIPQIKALDCGRYIGTWDIVVLKDLDSNWVNWGIYRCMVKDERNFTVLLLPAFQAGVPLLNQHGGAIFGKYEAAKKPMPVALVIGANPACHFAAMTSFDYGVSEEEMAGGLYGSGVPLVKCETSDLMVPADAELVVEAEVLPGVRVDEGPFGEYTGHVAHSGQAPLARVTCITHRRDPIFTMANMGKPYDDCATPRTILHSALVKNRLERNGIAVKSVYYPGTTLAPIIAVKPAPAVHQKIISTLLTAQRLLRTGIVFVDEDVDVTDLEDLWWAITTRMHPKSYRTVDGVAAESLMPFLTPEERQNGESSVWVMNATIPYSWPEKFRADHAATCDYESAWSPEVRQRVERRWAEYGYGNGSGGR